MSAFSADPDVDVDLDAALTIDETLLYNLRRVLLATH
jgi:hypothetical protein